MTNSRLRILRVERGLRQIELALRCGINCARISHIENNLIEATPTEKQKIAKALNVRPAEIWDDPGCE
jgi:transcriptional regulator with XRE-family HTH domain